MEKISRKGFLKIAAAAAMSSVTAAGLQCSQQLHPCCIFRCSRHLHPWHLHRHRQGHERNHRHGDL